VRFRMVKSGPSEEFGYDSQLFAMETELIVYIINIYIAYIINNIAYCNTVNLWDFCEHLIMFWVIFMQKYTLSSITVYYNDWKVPEIFFPLICFIVI